MGLRGWGLRDGAEGMGLEGWAQDHLLSQVGYLLSS